ncbi:hypothetical protein XM25_00710 [Devosia sp. H5989]|nr:hypothetical protein XM25_00710 [Devosia sp. H5989]
MGDELPAVGKNLDAVQQPIVLVTLAELDALVLESAPHAAEIERLGVIADPDGQSTESRAHAHQHDLCVILGVGVDRDQGCAVPHVAGLDADAGAHAVPARKIVLVAFIGHPIKTVPATVLAFQPRGLTAAVLLGADALEQGRIGADIHAGRDDRNQTRETKRVKALKGVRLAHAKTPG